MKWLIMFALLAWVCWRGKFFLAKLWMAFVDPVLRKMGDSASELVEKSTEKDLGKPLSKQEADELRRQGQ